MKKNKATKNLYELYYTEDDGSKVNYSKGSATEMVEEFLSWTQENNCDEDDEDENYEAKLAGIKENYKGMVENPDKYFAKKYEVELDMDFHIKLICTATAQLNKQGEIEIEFTNFS